jgi:hypothetical protein
MATPKDQLRKLAEKQKKKQKISDQAVRNVEKTREAAKEISRRIRQTTE